MFPFKKGKEGEKNNSLVSEVIRVINFAEQIGNLNGKVDGIHNHVSQLDNEVQERDNRRHEEIEHTETRIMSHIRTIEKRQSRNFHVLLIALLFNTAVVGFVPEEDRAEVFKSVLEFIL